MDVERHFLVEMDNHGEQELGKQLMTAAADGDIEAVMNLMRYGAPFAIDWWGKTALHHAAQKGRLEMVRLLIDSGILIDSKSKVDKTPLHMACHEGHTEVAKYLLAKGADVNAMDKIYMTPLHWAVEEDHWETAQLLLQNGALVDALNKFDKTPADIAHDQSNHAMLILLADGNIVGPYTVRSDSPNFIDVSKPRISVNLNHLKERRVIHGSQPSPKKTLLALKGQNEQEMWQCLEQHGIEFLEGEDVSIVAAALGSGQSVSLTEAGRQALTLTEAAKQRALTASSTGSKAMGETARVARIAVPRSTAKTVITLSSRKRPHASSQDALSQLTAVSKNYFEAQREAKEFKEMYAKKMREAALYYTRLKIALKSMKGADNQDINLTDADEDEGQGESSSEEMLINRKVDAPPFCDKGIRIIQLLRALIYFLTFDEPLLLIN